MSKMLSSQRSIAHVQIGTHRSYCRAPFLPARQRSIQVQAAPSTPSSLKDSPLVPVKVASEFSEFPKSAGVYAVYDAKANIQYIGLSRRIDVSVYNHYEDLPDLTHSVKSSAIKHATKESLTDAWTKWMQEAVEATGDLPPGNQPGETKWHAKAKPPRPEIKLTSGKGICGTSIEKLIDSVVKDVKVVVFAKGTRTQPACGFSHKMLTILNQCKAEYEVVNVLDEVHNPGLREAIKAYSQWPTIPQLYIGSEFIGGSDIVEKMAGSGELQTLLHSVGARKP